MGVYMISVIVAVHNDEEFLHICLNSILKQDFQDFEIICIDDCSSDNSLEILEYFAKKDSRIKLLKNSVYTGKGFSRNKCLNIAKGKYILFLDGNECITHNALDVLIEKSEKNGLDVLIFKSMFLNKRSGQFSIDSNHEQIFSSLMELEIFNHQDLNKSQLFDFPVEPTNKFYLKSFLDENDIAFSKRFTKFEDISFFL